jgi:hypothetical protein
MKIYSTVLYVLYVYGSLYYERSKIKKYLRTKEYLGTRKTR